MKKSRGGWLQNCQKPRLLILLCLLVCSLFAFAYSASYEYIRARYLRANARGPLGLAIEHGFPQNLHSDLPPNLRALQGRFEIWESAISPDLTSNRYERVEQRNENGESLLILEIEKLFAPEIFYLDGIRPRLYTIKRLLARERDADIRDHRGRTPLIRMAEIGLLAQPFKPWAEDSRAQDQAFFELIDLLLEAGGNINASDDLGRTPLICAVSGESAAKAYQTYNLENRFLTQPADFLSLLLASGADVNVRDEQGRTCLHVDRPPKSIKLLAEAGADPNAADADGRTPLFYAGSSGALNSLIEAGAEVDHRAGSGETPLLAWMRRRGTLEGVRVLLNAGANPTLEDGRGVSPLSLAKEDSFYVSCFPSEN
jgi:ankyrin repeat protein